jgi:hypothetical protein
MPLKINTNQSATAYHIVGGAFHFPYAVDAHHAISNHPLEWSADPWTLENEATARQRFNGRAQQTGAAPLPEPPVLTPEEQAAIDEHAKAVAEANERLAEFRRMKAREKEFLDRVAADEALVASPPPRPDPTIRRPFGRKGEPTPAELKMIDDKAKADAQARANVTKSS